jgi:hypothetical protein
MDQSFEERLSKLRKAHHVLRQETESLARYGPIGAEALCRLRDKARDLQEQAHSLLVTMAYQDVPEPLQEEAEDLVRAFTEAVSQSEAGLTPGKRRS